MPQPEGESLVDQRPKDVPPAKVPDFVTFNPGLKGVRGAAAVRLYCVLDRHVNGKTRVAFPGWRKLALAMKCSLSLLSQAIQALERIKAIRVTRKKRGANGRAPNVYYLLPVASRVPAEWKGQKPTAKESLQLRLIEEEGKTPKVVVRIPTDKAVAINAKIEDLYATLDKPNLPDRHRSEIKTNLRQLEQELENLREKEE